MTAEDGTTVGVIGLGLLGSAIGRRLQVSGFTVHGFDLDAARCAEATDGGIQVSKSHEDVFRQCPTVFFSLPVSADVAEVLGELPNEIVRGRTVIDTTTGDPDQMVAIGRGLMERGAVYIEATVAGSSEATRAGHAVLFLGGSGAAVASAQSVLSAVSDFHFHLGPLGSASRFKLVHNLVLGLNRAVLAEGLEFADSLGFDREQVLDILQQTPAASDVMSTKGPKMVNDDFAPQARLSQHLKDVRLIIQQAEHAGAKVPLTTFHELLLAEAESLGFGDVDNSAIVMVYRRKS